MKKRFSAVVAAMLLLVACLMMTGCSNIEGRWQLNKLEVGGNSYTIEELAEKVNSQKADEVSITLEISEEEFVLYSGEKAVAEGTCSEAENGYIFEINGRSVNAEKSGSELILHDTSSEVESKMIFIKK